MRWFLTYTMAVLLIISLFPLSEALAKDVCVEDSVGAYYIFKAMKALKKPGQVAPLNGIFVSIMGNNSAPLHGTAYVRGDGSIDIGFYVHNNVSGTDWTVQLKGSTFETASGVYQYPADVKNPYAFVGAVDCGDLPLPPLPD